MLLHILLIDKLIEQYNGYMLGYAPLEAIYESSNLKTTLRNLN
jgi:hypothetical protein